MTTQLKLGEGFAQTFLQGGYTHGQQAMVTRKLQVKITVRHHFIPTRMATIKEKVTHVNEDVEK